MSKRKLNNVLKWIVQGQNFVNAYQAVRQNKGAPGIDGLRVEEMKSYLAKHWNEVKQSILDGSYEPQAVRSKKIRKTGGGYRQLGIPTVMDRIIQQSIHQLLSPHWEKQFSGYSYGFRPKRSASDALQQSTKYINAGRHWIIDLDLKSFFDKVDHDKLMHLIANQVEDKGLLQLIRKYLQSDLVETGKILKRRRGTPQGGPLSPLLSNILLNELDKELESRGHKFVRYADDCSIFLKSERAAKRVLASISRFIEEKLLLEVNQTKTTICRPLRFTILGHGYVSSYKKGDRGKYRLCISKASWRRLKKKIKVITRKTSPIPFEERIQRLNMLMRGWLHYFKEATGHEKLRYLDSWIRCRLRYCIWKSWKKPKRRIRAFIQLGVPRSWAIRYGYSRMGGWAIACSPIMGTTITEARLRQKGYISFLEYYHLIRKRK
jgi:group II intron reverse transcriptase/maturase